MSGCYNKTSTPIEQKESPSIFKMVNFLSKHKMQLYLLLFYIVLRQQNSFEWTLEHQKF